MSGLSLGCLFALLLCGAVSAAPKQDSVLGQILSSEYTGLAKLLEDANLLSELESGESEDLTIFAPSDLYLNDKAPAALLNFLTQPGNIEYLRKVLLHHIVPRKINVKSWYPGETVQTLAGSDATLYLEDGVLKVSGVPVKDIGVLEGSDGVVHGIQGFLVPDDVKAAMEEFNAQTDESRRFLMDDGSMAAPAPSPSSDLFTQLAGALQADGSYSTLLGLITSLGLTTSISSILDKGEKLTLLAPENDAFVGLNLTGTDPASILLYHVVYGSYTYDDLLAIGNGSATASPAPTSRRLLQSGSGTLYTVSGSTITVTVVANAVYVNQILVGGKDLFYAQGLSAQGIVSVLVPPTGASSPPPPVSTGTASPPPPPASAGNALQPSAM